MRPYQHAHSPRCKSCNARKNAIAINSNEFEGSKDKQRASLKKWYSENTHWGKGLKRPDHVVEALRNSSKNRIYTEEQHKVMSIRSKGENNHFYGKKHSEESLAKMRNIQQELARSGKKKIRGKIQKFIDRKGREFTMRSTWECKFASYLDSLNVDWEYEIKIFNLVLPCGKPCTYTPDFYIPLTDEFIEIKGHWYDHSLVKHQCFIEQWYSNDEFTSDMTVITKDWLQYKNIL